MGILRRLVDAFDPPETRAEDPSWSALSGLRGGAGILVNHRMAENLSTVLACVNAIAGSLGSLPAYVYRRNAGGRTADEGHPLQRIIRRGPNAHQTWPEFVEFLAASTLLRGNGLAEIVVDRAGDPVELRTVPWDLVSVSLLPSGRLAYDVADVTYLGGGSGRPRRLLEGEVIHLRDRTDDGLLGKSRLARAYSVVEAGAHVQNFATAMYRNGLNPSGIVEASNKMSNESLRRLREHFDELFSGTANAARAMILDQGLTWKQLSVSPEDAELLASRRFSVEELARLFGCPPPIIGDLSHGTFTNSETAGRWFATHTLTPWIRKIEAEFGRSVFREDERDVWTLEFDLSGFLRGDPEQRWKAHEIAVKNDILTRNEVREIEGWNPRAGGDAPAGAAADA